MARPKKSVEAKYLTRSYSLPPDLVGWLENRAANEKRPKSAVLAGLLEDARRRGARKPKDK